VRPLLRRLSAAGAQAARLVASDVVWDAPARPLRVAFPPPSPASSDMDAAGPAEPAGGGAGAEYLAALGWAPPAQPAPAAAGGGQAQDGGGRRDAAREVVGRWVGPGRVKKFRLLPGEDGEGRTEEWEVLGHGEAAGRAPAELPRDAKGGPVGWVEERGRRHRLAFDAAGRLRRHETAALEARVAVGRLLPGACSLTGSGLLAVGVCSASESFAGRAAPPGPAADQFWAGGPWLVLARVDGPRLRARGPVCRFSLGPSVSKRAAAAASGGGDWLAGLSKVSRVTW
jgi:YD repeat-containing protein